MASTDEPDHGQRLTRREEGPMLADAGHLTRTEQPAGTRRERLLDATPGRQLLALPSALDGRFTIVKELSSGGSEADLILVRDSKNTRFVVKVYRRGVTLDPKVCEQVSRVGRRHVVQQVEHGQSDGRDYEVLEYLPRGDLRRYLNAHPGPFPYAEIERIVAQFASALVAIHAVNVVHRDLKPENVLLRQEKPIELVLADFGVSKQLSSTVHFTSVAHTPAYASPESINGEASRPGDWWSLGMIVRELACGRDLFVGMTPRTILGHLISRAIPLDEVTDPRLRLLCRGLLVKDPASRWGAEQVRAWLDGQSPVVPDVDPGTTPDIRPLYFAGQELVTRRSAAEAIAGNWASARNEFFPRPGASEGLRTLADWMRQFDDSAASTRERVALVDGPLATEKDGDLRVLLLLRWLDHHRPPVVRGRTMNPQALLQLVIAATDPAAAGHDQAVAELNFLGKSRALRHLGKFQGGDQLVQIDRAWRELGQRWNNWARTLMARGQGYAQALGLASDLAEVGHVLLDLVLRPELRSGAIVAAARETRSQLGARVPWLASLYQEAGDNLIRLLAVVVLGRLAAAEVKQADLATEVERQRVAARRQQWRNLEEERTSRGGRLVGMLWAATGVLAFAAVAGSLMWLAIDAAASSGVASTQLWNAQTAAVPVGVVAVVAGLELGFGAMLGRAYHPGYSLALGVARTLKGVGGRLIAVARSFGQAGCMGFAALMCCLCGLLGAVPWSAVDAVLPTGMPYAVGAMGLGWLVWSVNRLFTWHRNHRDLRRRIVGA